MIAANAEPVTPICAELPISQQRTKLSKRVRTKQWMRDKKNKALGKHRKGCPELRRTVHDQSCRRSVATKEVCFETPTLETDDSFVSAVSDFSSYDIWNYAYDFVQSSVGRVVMFVPRLLQGTTNNILHRTPKSGTYGTPFQTPHFNSISISVPSPDIPSGDDRLGNTENLLQIMSFPGGSKHAAHSELSARASLGIPDDYNIDNFPSLYLIDKALNNSEEIALLALSMKGHWITLMHRSDNIEAQFKFLGISVFKRGVLSRIAIPLSVFLEGYNEYSKDFSTVHTWIHTPLGLRHLTWALDGSTTVQEDCDCGAWEGSLRVVSMYIPVLNKNVRALQRVMRRPNDPKSGITVETRIVLPDVHEKKVMVFQIDAFPHALTTGDLVTDSIHTTRVLKFVHTVDNIRDITQLANYEADALKGCESMPSSDNN